MNSDENKNQNQPTRGVGLSQNSKGQPSAINAPVYEPLREQPQTLYQSSESSGPVEENNTLSVEKDNVTGNVVGPSTPVNVDNNLRGGENLQSPVVTSSNSLPPKPKKEFPMVLLILAAVLLVGFVVGGIFVFGKKFGKKTVEVKKITWWNLWEDDAVVRPLIQEYETKNPNVKIEYIKQSPQDYRERLVNSLAKGSGPDIFVFHNTWVPMLSRDLDRVPASVAGSADFARDYYYVISSDLTVGSGLVGIPLGYDALTLFINEDIFKEAGLGPPKTWVELRDYARRLTMVENGKIVRAGIALGRTENVDHWQEILGLMLIQNNVNFSDPEPDLVENALSFYTIFSRSDKVWDETLPTSTAAFAGGRLAMYFGPSWRYFNIKEANPLLNFRTVPLPQVPKEDPQEPDVSYATYWVQGVWAKGSNKNLAWDFLRFVSSKESLEKMYKQASLYRGFGEPYPRTDMGNLILEDPIVGSVVKLAPSARSWYLASRTFDGPTGINSQLSKYFEDAINAINDNEDLKNIMETLLAGIKQVLTQYGLAR